MSPNSSKAVNLPSLPSSAFTRDGVEFDPREPFWSVSSHTTTVLFSFDLQKYISESLLNSFKLVILWYLENKSVMHAKNIYEMFDRFFKFASNDGSSPLNIITSFHFINYRSVLEKRREWYLGVLTGPLNEWHALGYPGVEKELITLINQLSLRGNIKGEAVRTLDPNTGPFSDIELEAIHESSNFAYSKGEIDLEEYLLVWLFSALGARPIQYAALKIRDFIVIKEKGQTPVYLLWLPRAKQRNIVIRTEFKERKLIPQIGELVEKHIETLKSTHPDLLNNLNDYPLFPRIKKRAGIPAIPGFEFHHTSKSISIKLQQIFDKLTVISERTGKPINIHARRFRYTLGTRAAMEGAGELVIAELLDHTDTQNAGVYVEARPEIIERIDKAVAMQLAPLAQAFCGVIIDDERNGTRGDDPTSRVIDPQSDPSLNPVGTCGKYGFCGFAAPVACYTCRNFQPWLDGPHEAVLDRLIKEREDIATKTADLRIASVNDRTILAVADVVRRCREIRASRKLLI